MKITKSHMTFRSVLVSTFILTNLFICQNIIASPSAPMISQSEGDGNRDAILKYLLPTLKMYGKVGRIYYQSKCQSDNDYPIPFPLTKVKSPSESKTGLIAVREIFQKDKNVKVTEDRPGIISIYIGKPSSKILGTRISYLIFEPIAQYNFSFAFNAIENNKEVRATMVKYGFTVPSIVSNAAIVQPTEGLLHLPSSIENVSMDQALDLVARTFKGTVIYGACSEPNLYSIDFTGGIYFDESKLQ